MKKLIALLMIICLAACGCSKEETPKSEPITETPTQEITTTPIPPANIKCDVCGRTADCKEIIRTRYDRDLQRDIDKAFHLCDNCYEGAVQDEKDIATFNDLKMALNIAITNEEYMNLEGTIDISEYGINASSGLEDLLKFVNDFFDTNELKTSRDYTIEIKNNRIYSEKNPKSILDTLD